MIAFGKSNSTLLGIFLIFSLGCGSDDSEPEPNQFPTVLAENQEVIEKNEVSITASASDSDGQIDTYSWSQVSGEYLELTGENSSTLRFTAPQVTVKTDLVFNIEVSDDAGATVSTNVTVTVLPILLSVTIEGVATDNPISNANISINIGSLAFSTTADENGQYSIDLIADDSYSEEQVVAVATGPEIDSIIELRSLLGDFASLVENAGEDSTLTKDEFFSVNITHVSSAIAELMEQANGNVPISSISDFENSAKAYIGSRVLPMATAIKLVVDYSADEVELELPKNIANTADFLKDLKAVGEYLLKAKNEFPALFENAQNSVIADEQAIANGAANSSIPIADSYYFISPTGNFSEGRMLLNHDGSGSLHGDLEMTSFNWSVTDSGVSIEYLDGPKIIDTLIENVGPITAEVQIISTGKDIRWLSQTAKADLLMISDNRYRHYPNAELPDEAQYTVETYYNAIKNEGVLDAASFIQMNTRYVFPNPTVIEDIEGLKAEGAFFGPPEYSRRSSTMVFDGNIEQGGSVTVTTLAINGEGITSKNSEIMTWQIEENGHLMIDGEQTYDYAFLLANDNETPFVNVLVEDGSNAFAGADHVLADSNIDWTTESAVGIYDLYSDHFSPLDHFWVEVNEDGTALTVTSFDRDRNGQLDAEDFTIMPGLWQINSAGNLVVRRYRLNSLTENSAGYCTPSTWDPADSETCLLYNEREWDLFQVTPSGEYYMDHLHRFYDDSARLWYENQNVSGHILSFATTDIRHWNKVIERPAALPVNAGTLAKSSLRLSANPY